MQGPHVHAKTTKDWCYAPPWPNIHPGCYLVQLTEYSARTCATPRFQAVRGGPVVTPQRTVVCEKLHVKLMNRTCKHYYHVIVIISCLFK